MTSPSSTSSSKPAHVSSPGTSSHSLGMWDTISLIVGIVVGVSIFRAPSIVFSHAGSPEMGLLLWGIGAVLALCGALCYCELATAYPGFGGEYQYLGEAYHRRVAFLFGWMRACIILTGSIGAMAFVFEDYAAVAINNLSIPSKVLQSSGWLAALVVIVLTLFQLAGMKTGKQIQNVLTIAKVVSLTGLLICGFLLVGQPHPVLSSQEITPPNWSGIGIALVFVLYAYGGWSDAASVTPEVRDYRKNMPLALLLGLGIIALLYLVMNIAYLRVLGFEGIQSASAPAASVIEQTLGSRFSVLMSLMVMISALGAIHGMMFAGCRLLAAVGKQERLFSSWNQWNERNVPVFALLTLSGISLLLITLVGTEIGRRTFSTMVSLTGVAEISWDQHGGGFSTLVDATAPVFWFFFALTALSVIVLRYRDADRPRPFRVPGYPLPPLIFFAFSVYMLWSSVNYAGKLTLLSVPPLVLGVVISFLSAPQESA